MVCLLIKIYHILPGFSLQSYFGLQKSSTMDGTNTQMSQKVEEPAKFMPPKIEISDTESKRVSPRPHKLKPRDMNVLTPSGFWGQPRCLLPFSLFPPSYMVANLLSCPLLPPLLPCKFLERLRGMRTTWECWFITPMRRHRNVTLPIRHFHMSIF